MAEIQDTATAVQFMAQELPYPRLPHIAYAVTVTPEYGRPVTLYVRDNPRSTRDGHLVSRELTGESRITAHKDLAAAVRAANRRANKYLTQHSKPFGTQKAKVLA